MDPAQLSDDRLDAWYAGMLDAEDAVHAALCR